MRTTQLTRQKGKTAGQKVSDLARRGLQPKKAPRMRNGVLLFTPKAAARKPHLARVNRLRDSE